MPLRLSSNRLETQLRALGVPVSVRCHGGRAAELHAAVADAWRDCAAPAHQDAAPVDVLVDVLLDDDDELVRRARLEGMTAATSLEQVLHDLSPVVTEAVITRNAGDLFMLHAAGLAAPGSGACVALVAPSGTGKTTAARVLGRELGYVSDETVGIAPDRAVVAYPKPLSVIERSGSGLKTQSAASVLGLRRAPDRLTLAGILFLDRDPSRTELRVEPVPTLRALAALAPQTSYLARLPAPLHRVADLLQATGGLRRVRYREAEELVDVVHDLLGHVA